MLKAYALKPLGLKLMLKAYALKLMLKSLMLYPGLQPAKQSKYIKIYMPKLQQTAGRFFGVTLCLEGMGSFTSD